MYRVSPFVRHYAKSLLGGAALATLWVNLSPASYYDMVEFRLIDMVLPQAIGGAAISVTPLTVVSNGLMALFMFFIGKEVWEALVLERSTLKGRSGAALPMGAVLGGMAGAVAAWLIFSVLFETAAEASFGTGWPVPLGSDVVLGYMFGRMVFGADHPALHLLLLIGIGQDILGLLVLGLANPGHDLAAVWLILPVVASGGVWLLIGRQAHRDASERQRRAALALWPYMLAGVASWIGVAMAGLPPALGLLPVIPAIPHANRSFGLFAEAEVLLHDPLNQLAHLLVRVVAWVLFAFGLTRGGVDLSALAPTTGTVLAAFWLGKPAGVMAGALAAMALRGGGLPPGIRLRDLCLIAVIPGAGFTVPVLALDIALPGGAMAEAARLGLAISLLAGPAALILARIRRA